MRSTLVEESRASRRLPSPALAREIRRDAGVTQVRFAAELGVHWTTVARWESGARRPRGELRLTYARLLAELAQESAA